MRPIKLITAQTAKLWRFGPLVLVTVGLVLAGPGASFAESTRFYDIEGFEALLDGNPETTALRDDGGIVLPPQSRERFADASMSFSAAAALGNEVAVAAADDGKVLAIDRAGKKRLLFSPSQQMVTAMLATGTTDRPALLVATGPTAHLYRVAASGKTELLFESTEHQFIWDMAFGANGDILAATGGPGHLLRISTKSGASGSTSESGDGETAQMQVVYESDQEHLRAVAWASDIGVVVGGGARGVVYVASPKALGKGHSQLRALYDSGYTEITGITIIDGVVYAAAVSGADALVAEQGNASPAHSAGKANNGNRRGRKGAKVRSQLIRIETDGTAEVLAGSNDEGIFAVHYHPVYQLLVSTGATGREDPRGRLYSIDPKSRVISLLYQGLSQRLTHVVTLPRDAMALVGGAGGRVIHLSGGLAKTGDYFTEPVDLEINSKVGSVSVLGSVAPSTSVSVAVRSGQTTDPDATWSTWKEATPANNSIIGGQLDGLTNGRYAQVRLRLHGDGEHSPALYRVRLAYLRRNLAPFVRKITVLNKGVALVPMAPAGQKQKTISLRDKIDSKKNDRKPHILHGTKARQVRRRGALTIRWLAEDPNDDKLLFKIMVKKTGDNQWKTLAADLEHPFYTLSSSQLPDGYYRFQVTANDSRSNPRGRALVDRRESRSVLIDNSAPTIAPIVVKRDSGNVTATFAVHDSVGPLINAEYSIDGEHFEQALPQDGILDGPSEDFAIQLGNLGPGTHSLTMRVEDDAANQGYGETLFLVE